MKKNEMTTGCPKCGTHSLLSMFRFCPYCYGVRLVPGTKAEFDRINAKHGRVRRP